MNHFAVIDIETTGLPKEDEGCLNFSGIYPTEVAMVVWKRHGEATTIDEDSTLLKIPPDAAYCPEAEKISGITREMCETTGVTPTAAAGLLASFIANHETNGLPLVTHNGLCFDLPILFNTVPLCIPRAIDLDTKLIWKAFSLGLRRGKDENLHYFYGRVAAARFNGKSSLAHLFRLLCGQVDITAHRAVSDCMVTAEVFSVMVERGIVGQVLGNI